MKALKIEIPLLPVYLVQGQEDIYKIRELKGYVLPDLDGQLLRRCTSPIRALGSML